MVLGRKPQQKKGSFSSWAYYNRGMGAGTWPDREQWRGWIQNQMGGGGPSPFSMKKQFWGPKSEHFFWGTCRLLSLHSCTKCEIGTTLIIGVMASPHQGDTPPLLIPFSINSNVFFFLFFFS